MDPNAIILIQADARMILLVCEDMLRGDCVFSREALASFISDLQVQAESLRGRAS